MICGNSSGQSGNPLPLHADGSTPGLWALCQLPTFLLQNRSSRLRQYGCKEYSCSLNRRRELLRAVF